jgi:S-adenosylmethionine:tRNA-ribosyltransferase-isomerase (queuine synthetase)
LTATDELSPAEVVILMLVAPSAAGADSRGLRHAGLGRLRFYSYGDAMLVI